MSFRTFFAVAVLTTLGLCSCSKQGVHSGLSKVQQFEREAWAYSPADAFAWARLDARALAQSSLGVDLHRWVGQFTDWQGQSSELKAVVDEIDVVRVAFRANTRDLLTMGTVILDGTFAPGQIEKVFATLGDAPVTTVEIQGKAAHVIDEVALYRVDDTRVLIGSMANLKQAFADEHVPALPADVDRLTSSTLRAVALNQNNGGAWLARTVRWGPRQLNPRTTSDFFNRIDLSGTFDDGIDLRVHGELVEATHAQRLVQSLNSLRARYEVLMRIAGLGAVIDGLQLTHEERNVTASFSSRQLVLRDLIDRLDPEALMTDPNATPN